MSKEDGLGAELASALQLDQAAPDKQPEPMRSDLSGGDPNYPEQELEDAIERFAEDVGEQAQRRGEPVPPGAEAELETQAELEPEADDTLAAPSVEDEAPPPPTILEQAGNSIAGQLRLIDEELKAQHDYFTSGEFAELEQTNPGLAALHLSKASDRRSTLAAIQAQLKPQLGQVLRHVGDKRTQAFEQKCVKAIPAWEDEGTRKAEIKQIREYALKQGYSEQQLENIWSVPEVQALRDAMLSHRAASAPTRQQRRRAGIKINRNKSDRFERSYQTHLAALKKSGRKGTNTKFTALRMALEDSGMKL